MKNDNKCRLCGCDCAGCGCAAGCCVKCGCCKGGKTDNKCGKRHTISPREK